MTRSDSVYEIPGPPHLPAGLFRTKEEIMNEAGHQKPKSTLEQLQAIRDIQLKEVETAYDVFLKAKEELKRLDKAIKQWEPKE